MRKKNVSAFPSSLKLYRYISSFPLTRLSLQLLRRKSKKDKRISDRISAVSSFSVRLSYDSSRDRNSRRRSPFSRTSPCSPFTYASFLPGEITSGVEGGGSRASRYVVSRRAWRRRRACLRSSPPANSPARSAPGPTSAARSNATGRPRPRWSRAGTGTAG